MLYQEENPPTKFVQIDTISRPVSITLFTHIRAQSSFFIMTTWYNI